MYRNKTPENIEELKDKNISTDCPHCGDTVALIPQHKPVVKDGYAYFVALCPNHKRSFCKPIFAKYQALNNCIDQRYPIPSLDAHNLHKSIPESIRIDYAEALRCMYANAYKGAVALLRRTIEGTACNILGGKSKDEKGKTLKLYKLIDLLKKEGLITKNIQDSAHEIRHFGNYGVHVQDDGLDKVEFDEARDAKEIAAQILDTIYISPFKTKALSEKRKKKQKKE